uniref:Glycosyltransferase n=1 Tax=Kalanchoe fedtschenkoi TaxID=63787 RepID=A0A7N0TU75_KALFE
MGHLTPSLRLAAALSTRGCRVTLITPHPNVSLAESNHLSAFLSSHPTIDHHPYHLPPSSHPTVDDPFFEQVHAIRCSLHLLRSILDRISLTALVTDIFFADSITGILSDLDHTPQLRPLHFFRQIPSSRISSHSTHGRRAAAVWESRARIPPCFAAGKRQSTAQVDGVLVNTFSGFEATALEALNNGRVVRNLPPILPSGMLPPVQMDIQGGGGGDEVVVGWLDAQPPGSVVLLSFGSRTAMSRDRIAEIAEALELSKQRFVWILKGSKVDREDKDDPFLDRIRAGGRSGLVMREWVDQAKILSHPAIGGFVSHCGWNSVTEAAARGVPVLAWPLNGDQKVNAEVVVEAGVGTWDRNWGWGGERLVGGGEIVRKLMELMGDAELKRRAASVGEETRRAVDDGGSFDRLLKLIENKSNNSDFATGG